LAVLQERIGWLLKRPVGRPPRDIRRYYASFSYQAALWTRSDRVVAKVEWHPGALYPRVGFIVTNMTRPPERVVMCGTAEQRIKEREERDRLDPPVLSPLRRQRGATATARSGLQPRQLPPHPDLARGGQAVVDGDVARPVGQD
jgi:hypothetical protein